MSTLSKSLTSSGADTRAFHTTDASDRCMCTRDRSAMPKSWPTKWYISTALSSKSPDARSRRGAPGCSTKRSLCLPVPLRRFGHGKSSGSTHSSVLSSSPLDEVAFSALAAGARSVAVAVAVEAALASPAASVAAPPPAAPRKPATLVSVTPKPKPDALSVVACSSWANWAKTSRYGPP